MSYIRRSEERVKSDRNNVQSGPGHMVSHRITVSDEELLGKGRLFSENILEKECGVGWHVHTGDAEIYLLLSGECEYDDNGAVTTLHAGDVTYTGPGEGHSITNHRDEPAYFIALILYE